MLTILEQIANKFKTKATDGAKVSLFTLPGCQHSPVVAVSLCLTPPVEFCSTMAPPWECALQWRPAQQPEVELGR